MVPVGLNAKQSQLASVEGGNAVGSIMVKLGTDLDDPAARLQSVHDSMRDGKEALSSMTPLQILAMSAVGQAPAILTPILRMQGIVRPPYNLIISNVPGPRTTHYFNGAQLLGMYPLSIPIDGMALNITCTSYDGKHVLRPDRLPADRAAPAAAADPPRRRARGPGEGRRHLTGMLSRRRYIRVTIASNATSGSSLRARRIVPAPLPTG